MGTFREVVLSLGGGGVEVRAYVSPGFDLSGPLTARFGRVLLYREGVLVHEFNGPGRWWALAPAIWATGVPAAARDDCRRSPG